MVCTEVDDGRGAPSSVKMLPCALRSTGRMEQDLLCNDTWLLLILLNSPLPFGGAEHEHDIHICPHVQLATSW